MTSVNNPIRKCYSYLSKKGHICIVGVTFSNILTPVTVVIIDTLTGVMLLCLLKPY